MGRTLVCALDESPTARHVALWLVNNIARAGDTVHLIAVAPPPTYTMTPAAPIASAGAVAALGASWERQRAEDEERCRHQLHQLVHHLPESTRDSLDIHRHVLPAAGGASGVAESVVAFIKDKAADLVVVGSRGMGAVKSTFMSLVGLGSVSSYLVHNMHCAVGVCRGRELDAAAKLRKKVVVSLDDSETSKTALQWALRNALGAEDELHLVCVALPIPYPVSAFTNNHLPQPDLSSWRRQQGAALREAELLTRRSLHRALAGSSGAQQEQQIVAEDAVASEVLEADEYDAASQDSLHYAREIVTKAVDDAAAQVDKKRIFFKALAPEGGASDVGASIVHYAKENEADVVVLGARGMGSFRRALMTFVGLGSVSDYVVHHVECPVIVVKH